MKQTYRSVVADSIRLSLLLSLIFFACNNNKESKRITIVWTAQRAVAISIPESMLPELEKDSLLKTLHLRLPGNDTIAILGSYASSNDEIVFTPLIPFSAGLQYHLFYRNQLIDTFEIPIKETGKKSTVVEVYPALDTLPENLLKMYVKFSTPMREGEALQHISLLDDQKDTLAGIFLDLQPELWNETGTVLTLWLDPGRIKRDLIPNKRFGNPLMKNRHYELAIDASWKDVHDQQLAEPFRKRFVVGSRDSLSPDINAWQLSLPFSQTFNPLTIDATEPLDYFLLPESVHLEDEKKHKVEGRIEILPGQKSFQFVPSLKWNPGRYRLLVDARLEDLAGNNIERPFDKDLLSTKKTNPVYERYFEVAENSALPGNRKN